VDRNKHRDDANYVEMSAGCDINGAYFYYQAVVDGNIFSEQEPRTSNDGTLYVSYNAATKDFYLSHSGFGSENAYVWVHPMQPVVRGRCLCMCRLAAVLLELPLASEAYLDDFDFLVNKDGLLNWPPATDLDNNGFIEIYDLAMLCDEWLENGPADFDHSGSVDFLDLVEFGWHGKFLTKKD